MSATDDLLSANGAVTGPGPLPSAPSRRVAVVTCMDARIDAYALLGLRPGEAHVIRNAGGVVTDDVVRSLAVSQRRLGTTEVMVVHHGGCGMTSFTDAEFAAELAADSGSAPPWAAQTFTDAATDVRASVTLLRASRYLPRTDAVRGFVLDVTTGHLDEVI